MATGFFGMVGSSAKMDIADSTRDSGFGRSFLLAISESLFTVYGLLSTRFFGMAANGAKMDVTDSLRDSGFGRSSSASDFRIPVHRIQPTACRFFLLTMLPSMVLVMARCGQR